MDIVDKAGSWFSYKDEKLGQGRENVKDFLEENPELMAQIDAEVRKSIIQDQDDEEEIKEEDKKEEEK